MFNLFLSLIIKDRKVYSSNDIDIDASNNKEHLGWTLFCLERMKNKLSLFPRI